MNEANGNVYPLDETIIDLLREMDETIRRMQEQANMQAAGMLAYFMRAHGLKGQWRVAPNRRELVLDESAVREPAAEPA